MSRRDRRRRLGSARSESSAGADPSPIDSGARPPSRDRATTPTLRDRLATATVPAAALLPLRFFLGLTFLYAGLDKLLDPRFFAATDPASIGAQLAAFARESPLSPLIKLVEPYALPIGLVIAVAEIAIGLGALTGLAFRAAAVGGACLSLVFWLSASWATHPYYYGPDLPYAAGWLTLALAGHGRLLVPQRWLPPDRGGAPVRRRAGDGRPVTSPERRAMLQAGLLAGIAVAVASMTVPLRLLGVQTGSRSTSPVDPGSGQAPGSLSSAPVGATGTPAAAGLKVATVSQVQRRGSMSFTVPFDAPAPLPAGDPGIVVQLKDGTFVAYDAVCTHEACTVDWDTTSRVLLCPCHAAEFDAADNGRVLAGPTDVPLASLPITVDTASGTIYLRG